MLACAAAVFAMRAGRSALPIKVGILHSRTGAMAISEKSMIDAELLAIGKSTPGAGFWGGRYSRWSRMAVPIGPLMPPRRSA